MTLHVYEDLEQGTDAWLAARLGMVTASTVGQLLEVTTLGADHFQCPTCLAQPADPCKSIAKGKAAGAPLKTMHPARGEAAAEAGVEHPGCRGRPDQAARPAPGVRAH